MRKNMNKHTIGILSKIKTRKQKKNACLATTYGSNSRVYLALYLWMAASLNEKQFEIQNNREDNGKPLYYLCQDVMAIQG